VTGQALAALRRSIAGLDSAAATLGGAAGFSLGHAAADAALGPLRRHGLHEVLAAAGQVPAAAGFVAGLLVRLGRRPVVWLRQDAAAREGGDLHAPGLAAFGLDPSRLLCVGARDARDLLKAAGDAFPADNDPVSGIGAVVIEFDGAPACLDLTASRRLLLAAQASGVAAVLLRPGGAAAASAATIRWEIAAAPSAGRIRAHGPGRPCFSVTVSRNRHGATGRWLMEWNGDAYSFHEPLPVAVVPAPVGRPDQAAPAGIGAGADAATWAGARRLSG
jgi:protein ImuA